MPKKRKTGLDRMLTELKSEIHISNKLKATIKHNMASRTSKVNTSTVKLVASGLRKKVDRLQKSTLPIKSKISRAEAFLYAVLLEVKEERRELSQHSIRLIVACLDYFIDPDDIIPDYVQGGYQDDAYVFQLTIQELAKDKKDFASLKEMCDEYK